jgi:hypothetical protein
MIMLRFSLAGAGAFVIREIVMKTPEFESYSRRGLGISGARDSSSSLHLVREREVSGHFFLLDWVTTSLSGPRLLLRAIANKAKMSCQFVTSREIS